MFGSDEYPRSLVASGDGTRLFLATYRLGPTFGTGSVTVWTLGASGVAKVFSTPGTHIRMVPIPKQPAVLAYVSGTGATVVHAIGLPSAANADAGADGSSDAHVSDAGPSVGSSDAATSSTLPDASSSSAPSPSTPDVPAQVMPPTTGAGAPSAVEGGTPSTATQGCSVSAPGGRADVAWLLAVVACAGIRRRRSRGSM